jgi:hypothetical protein
MCADGNVPVAFRCTDGVNDGKEARISDESLRLPEDS